MKRESTILITGATGFLGSNLLRRFVAGGLKVLVLARKTSNLSRIQDCLAEVRVFYVEDSDFEAIFKEFKVDAVVHCATNYGRKIPSPLSILEANLMLPLKLLQVGMNNGLKCFINTDTILDKRVSFYSLSKSQFRDWLKLYSEKLACVNVSLEHFYGPDDDESKFVTWVIQSMLRGVEKIDLTLGEQKRDFVYIDDVVRAFEKVLVNSLELRAGYFHYEIGTGNLVPIAEFINKIKSLSGNTATRLNFGAIPYRENEVMASHVDLANIRALGWEPEVPLESGLKTTIEMEKRKI